MNSIIVRCAKKKIKSENLFHQCALPIEKVLQSIFFRCIDHRSLNLYASL